MDLSLSGDETSADEQDIEEIEPVRVAVEPGLATPGPKNTGAHSEAHPPQKAGTLNFQPINPYNTPLENNNKGNSHPEDY